LTHLPPKCSTKMMPGNNASMPLRTLENTTPTPQ
jgi:hypothetical protein